MIRENKFRKGAASFYIVAFSTLILLIVATSFAAVIISEVERTSNDDLSQSAYDSAMAGLQDAKLAFYNYQNCLAQGDAASNECRQVIDIMRAAEPSCDMVKEILGRGSAIASDAEVVVKESDESGNNMQQAYTCVKVKTILDNYKATLSSSTSTKVVKLQFADGVKASQIKKMTVSWYMEDDETGYRYTNFPSSSGGVVFRSLKNTLSAVPPTISVGLVQTANPFTFDQFDMTVDNKTNRGMVYLVPTESSASSTNNQVITVGGVDNHRRAYNGSKNLVKQAGMLWSNDKTVTNRNLPYSVYCKSNSGQDYVCSAEIELPDPVGGVRNDDTFLVAVSLPYGKPTTSFMLEFDCGEDCRTEPKKDQNGNVSEVSTKRARLDGVQVEVDSTGRANDLYRRVETRLEAAGNDGNLMIMGPLELIGSGTNSGSSGNGSAMTKQMIVKCENNFITSSNC